MNKEMTIKETEDYFELIKNRLKNKINKYNINGRELSISDYVFSVPFNYDKDYLKKLCDAEEIKMWYSSTNDRVGMINYLPLHDIINFSQRTIDIIKDDPVLIKRRIG